jgi:ribosomal-protein-alanine N-acetyltransferase
MINVLTAKSGDIQTIADLEGSSFPDPMSEDFLSNVFTQNAYHFLVAKDGDKLVGHVVFIVIEEEMEITTIAVDKEYQSKGVGRQLLDSAIKLGKYKNANVCFLYVRLGNEGAQKLYKSAGFKEIGRVRKYYQGKADAIVMSMTI